MYRLTRRAFVTSVGRGTAGVLTGSVVAFRGREALAGTWPDVFQAAPLGDAALIRLDSNENPLGPGPVALDAIRAAFGEAGRYPDNPAVALTSALAKLHGVSDANIVLGSGSGENLRAGSRRGTGSRR